MRNLLSMKFILTFIICIQTIILSAQIDEAIKFKITDPNGNSDETIIRLKNESTQGFDSAWDAWKLFTSNDALPSLYSKTDSQLELAINSIPPMLKDTLVHLYIRARTVSGAYTITTEQLGSFPSGIKIALKDLETNIIYELNQNMNESFYVTADSLNDQMRFEVFYSTTAIATILDNDLTVTNNGCWNWNYLLEDISNNFITSGLGSSETFEIYDLPNGEHALYITDDYNLVDTVSVVINSEGLDTSALSFSDNSNPPINIFYLNGTLYVESIPILSETVSIAVYAMNGQLLIHQSEIPDSEAVNFQLGSFTEQKVVIVQVYGDSYRFTKKVIL
jgi:hypothetical protein